MERCGPESYHVSAFLQGLNFALQNQPFNLLQPVLHPFANISIKREHQLQPGPYPHGGDCSRPPLSYHSGEETKADLKPVQPLLSKSHFVV